MSRLATLLLGLATAASAQAGTSLALRATSADAAGLVACVAGRLTTAGVRLETAQQLASGLEARVALHTLTPPVASVSLALKPSPELLDHHHDDDPEAHPEIVAKLVGRLRIPITVRAWPMAPATCRDIADWLAQAARRPVLLDQLAD